MNRISNKKLDFAIENSISDLALIILIYIVTQASPDKPGENIEIQLRTLARICGFEKTKIKDNVTYKEFSSHYAEYIRKAINELISLNLISIKESDDSCDTSYTHGYIIGLDDEYYGADTNYAKIPKIEHLAHLRGKGDVRAYLFVLSWKDKPNQKTIRHIRKWFNLKRHMKISAILERFEINRKSLERFGVVFNIYYDAKTLRFEHYCGISKKFKDKNLKFNRLKRTAARKEVRTEQKNRKSLLKKETVPMYKLKQQALRAQELELAEYVRERSYHYHGLKYTATNTGDYYEIDVDIGIKVNGKILTSKLAAQIFKILDRKTTEQAK